MSVRNPKPFFINEKARKISPKLSRNFQIDSILFRRERKFIHIAHNKINGKAIIETSKLNHTIQRIDVGIIVHIFTQRITAKAEVKDNIPVHTKASTNTDITFEL